MPLRFFTDEDIHGALASELRKRGFDAVSTVEAGRSSVPDDSQLAWATSEERAIVTFNVGDFALLHTDWIESGRHHSGIVVSAQRPLGDLLRRLVNLDAALGEHGIADQLYFLSNW
jgi:hypothetical protein